MKRIHLYFTYSILALFAYSSCESAGSNDDVSISGVVVNGITGDPIDQAIVEITSPAEFSGTTIVTNETGTFSFTALSFSESGDVTIEVKKSGFVSSTIQVPVSSGLEINLSDPITLNPENTDDPGSGVSGSPAGAAVIILETISERSINIRETGGIVNSSFTFQVQDSSGRNVDLENAVDVTFSIISGPGGEEGILPLTVRTNSEGKVTSNLFSGFNAGVVQIQAEIVREDIGLTIRSKPVAITIHGGFPDIDHFSIAPAKYNFEGYSLNGQTNELTVILGDKFSNPVKPETAVYFKTTGGIIEGSGEGNTNDNGFVTVNLISGDPRPNDPETIEGVSFGGRPGLATLTAQTINEDNQIIEKSVNVVFSTSAALISANPTTFDLPAGGGATFSYTVTDLNGNPMAAGTSITVDAGTGMEVTGDVELNLGSALFPGPGATEFSFSIRDTDTESSEAADLSISITVRTPSGEETSTSPINGTRRKSIKK